MSLIANAKKSKRKISKLQPKRRPYANLFFFGSFYFQVFLGLQEQAKEKYLQSTKTQTPFLKASFFWAGFLAVFFFFWEDWNFFHPIGILPHHLLSRSGSSKKKSKRLEMIGQREKSGRRLAQGDGFGT